MCEARVIPVYNTSSELLSAVMEETGGLGVDIVVDSGGKKIKLLFLTYLKFLHYLDVQSRKTSVLQMFTATQQGTFDELWWND